MAQPSVEQRRSAMSRNGIDAGYENYSPVVACAAKMSLASFLGIA